MSEFGAVQNHFDLEDSIKRQTSLEDTFARLSRQDREEAFKVVRAKVGPNKAVSLKDMIEAHKKLKKVS
jgi:hypothetical protein